MYGNWDINLFFSLHNTKQSFSLYTSLQFPTKACVGITSLMYGVSQLYHTKCPSCIGINVKRWTYKV